MTQKEIKKVETSGIHFHDLLQKRHMGILWGWFDGEEEEEEYDMAPSLNIKYLFKF